MPRTFTLTEMVNRYECIEVAYRGFCLYKGDGEYLAIVTIDGCHEIWELDWEWEYNKDRNEHYQTYDKSLQELMKFYGDKDFKNMFVKVVKVCG